MLSCRVVSSMCELAFKLRYPGNATTLPPCDPDLYLFGLFPFNTKAISFKVVYCVYTYFIMFTIVGKVPITIFDRFKEGRERSVLLITIRLIIVL